MTLCYHPVTNEGGMVGQRQGEQEVDLDPDDYDKHQNDPFDVKTRNH